MIAGPAAAFKACQVTDVGGVDDKSFNQTAWKGVEDAMKKFGIEGKVLESNAETDYVPNVNAFLGDDCDLIITVGFLVGDATLATFPANSTPRFATNAHISFASLNQLVTQVSWVKYEPKRGAGL